MSSRPDDITGLLQKGPDPTAFRQGRLLTFNPVTGANTVLVQGGTLTNLPLLIEGGAFNLQGDDVLGAGNGNVVILMRMRSSWAILGRVLTQGDPNIINASDISQVGRFQNTFTVTGTNATVTSLSVPSTPAWANKVTLISTFSSTFTSTSATQVNIQLQHDVNGVAQTISPAISTSIPSVATACASVSDVVAFIIAPGSSLTIRGNAVAAPNNCTGAGFIVVSAQFQKV
jgi:hypothetical protein